MMQTEPNPFMLNLHDVSTGLHFQKKMDSTRHFETWDGGCVHCLYFWSPRIPGTYRCVPSILQESHQMMDKTTSYPTGCVLSHSFFPSHTLCICKRSPPLTVPLHRQFPSCTALFIFSSRCSKSPLSVP